MNARSLLEGSSSRGIAMSGLENPGLRQRKSRWVSQECIAMHGPPPATFGVGYRHQPRVPYRNFLTAVRVPWLGNNCHLRSAPVSDLQSHKAQRTTMTTGINPYIQDLGTQLTYTKPTGLPSIPYANINYCININRTHSGRPEGKKRREGSHITPESCPHTPNSRHGTAKMFGVFDVPV